MIYVCVMESGGLAGTNVLVVEDDGLLRRQITARLERLEVDVTGAASVAEAQRLATELSFDFVLLDIHLPDGSGMDLLRQLRAKRPVKAIAVSGYGMEMDLHKSREAGFLEHLIKQIDPVQLREAITRVLSD